MSRNSVIVFVDIVGSVALKQKYGSAIANQRIAARLAEIKNALIEADKCVMVPGPSEGDSMLATGFNLLGIFQTLVMCQHVWKLFKTGTPPVRISIGYGEYQVMENGALRGMQIDLAHRILAHCAPGSVVVTEAARPKIVDAGLHYKLIRAEADIKGLGMETFWKTNGTFVERRTMLSTPWNTFWHRQPMLTTLTALLLLGFLFAVLTAVLSALIGKWL